MQLHQPGRRAESVSISVCRRVREPTISYQQANCPTRSLQHPERQVSPILTVNHRNLPEATIAIIPRDNRPCAGADHFTRSPHPNSIDDSYLPAYSRVPTVNPIRKHNPRLRDIRKKQPCLPPLTPTSYTTTPRQPTTTTMSPPFRPSPAVS
ncbi:hypothetical protein SMACR_07511 [Sordaria macrospora]|uniref:Uncharacterized protein n=1 Tax=Sordaria macrospora TaxID=5147 RepID=A0A8S9A1J9_SORMA|nr:hypothetical protein SMACR_07511 [Sordaria macrospora]WPJ60880.1 hypothetical protein SMAC4_07511 [Sordaria macrospora]